MLACSDLIDHRSHSDECRLADYAVIVLHVKEMYNTSNPVFCFGGSYGGLLSALLRFVFLHLSQHFSQKLRTKLLRIKYGNVFWGSIASAAPLLGNKADPERWFSLVSESYVKHGILLLWIAHAWQLIRLSRLHVCDEYIHRLQNDGS